MDQFSASFICLQNKIEVRRDFEGRCPYKKVKAIKNAPRKYSAAIVK